MKTPEEWADQVSCTFDHTELIRIIQNEAYNQAIDDTAKLADDLFPECDSYSIIKLKK